MSKSKVYRPEVLETVEESVNKHSDDLRKLGIEIHDHPELAFQERHAQKVLTEFMELKGFRVTRQYLNLETAWRAEWEHKTGGRVIGVNSEMDALPGIGHACGHNLIAVAGVGIALAIRDALVRHDIAGKIILLGTPAEEAGDGKLILLDRGGYKEMDACLMCHPGVGLANSTGLGPSLAIRALKVEYTGHTSHAAAAPWEGQNALDAAFVAYGAVSALRQQTRPEQRIHGIILPSKDWAVNVVPDYAAMRWLVRAASAAEAQSLADRVKKCIEAGALATDCKVEIDDTEHGLFDLRQNTGLGENYADVMHSHFGWEVTDAPGAIGGSTDFVCVISTSGLHLITLQGNVTYAVPAIHPSYAIPSKPNGGNHTALFAEAAGTEKAHNLTMAVTKALAHTGFRVIDDDQYFAKVKSSFDKGEH